MPSIIYAIGDIHGRDDLLASVHDSITEHRNFFHGECDATLLYVGDYIDRGGDSLGVIDRVMRGVDRFETITLLGNHEAMLLDCLDSEDPENWSMWMQNGGLTTLTSLGVSLGSGSNDPGVLAAALGEDRVDWLRGLGHYHQTNRYLFVHAGLVPGVPITEQDPHDIIWIRGRFLDSETDHGRIVVHGHTPNEEVEVLPNRINIDTGAVYFGCLTAVALSDDNAPQFLFAKGEPGKGPISRG